MKKFSTNSSNNNKNVALKKNKQTKQTNKQIETLMTRGHIRKPVKLDREYLGFLSARKERGGALPETTSLSTREVELIRRPVKLDTEYPDFWSVPNEPRIKTEITSLSREIELVRKPVKLDTNYPELWSSQTNDQLARAMTSRGIRIIKRPNETLSLDLGGQDSVEEHVEKNQKNVQPEKTPPPVLKKTPEPKVKVAKHLRFDQFYAATMLRKEEPIRPKNSVAKKNESEKDDAHQKPKKRRNLIKIFFLVVLVLIIFASITLIVLDAIGNFYKHEYKRNNLFLFFFF